MATFRKGNVGRNHAKPSDGLRPEQPDRPRLWTPVLDPTPHAGMTARGGVARRSHRLRSRTHFETYLPPRSFPDKGVERKRHSGDPGSFAVEEFEERRNG